jgi:hypothetical protein
VTEQRAPQIGDLFRVQYPHGATVVVLRGLPNRSVGEFVYKVSNAITRKAMNTLTEAQFAQAEYMNEAARIAWSNEREASRPAQTRDLSTPECVLVDETGAERFRGDVTACVWVSRQLTKGCSTWTVDGRLLQVWPPPETGDSCHTWISRYAKKPTGELGSALRFEYESTEPAREEIAEQDWSGDVGFMSGARGKRTRAPRKIGIKHRHRVARSGHGRPWTEAEDQVMLSEYPRARDGGAIAKKLNRSLDSIVSRAKTLGIRCGMWWTLAEQETLANLWRLIPIKKIAAKLGRRVKTVHKQAIKMGLHMGNPDGTESIHGAATSRGYRFNHLERMLKSFGVKVRVREPTPGKEGKKYRRKYATTEDIEMAIAWWHDSEPVETAARRIGRKGSWLAFRLRSLGVSIVPGRKQTRVLSADVERAAKLEKMTDTATRRRMDPRSVKKALLASGLSVYQGGLLMPEIADAAIDAWLANPMVARRKAAAERGCDRKRMDDLKAAA